MERAEKRKPSLPLHPQGTKRLRSSGGKGDIGTISLESADESCTPLLGNVMPSYPSSFRRSRKPARFMFYEWGEWKDFSLDLSAALCAPFLARLSSTEFLLNGTRYLISFVHMLQVNLFTGFCRSIAWFDVEHQLFTPSKCIEGYILYMRQSGKACSRNFQDGVVPYPLKQHQVCNSGDTGSAGLARKCPTTHIVGDRLSSGSADSCSTITSSDSNSDVTLSSHDATGHTLPSFVVHGSHDFALLHDKMEKLNECDREFENVRDRFMAGLSAFANSTTVTGINRNCHKSTTGYIRHQAFKQQEEITKRIRGDANIRYAWYATSKRGVSSVVLHGIGLPKTPKDGAMYGVGVYLSPECYSNLSAVYADVDENGEQHVVLCRVIMGRMEQVSCGSDQFHPSSEDYDVGVDNLCNPKQYIVWTTLMNTHILPEYIVSFKLATPWHGMIAALKAKRKNFVHNVPVQTDCQKTNSAQIRDDGCREAARGCVYAPPRSPWVSIEMLFLLMKSKLSGSSMDALQQHYIDLKDGKLSSSDFNNLVRSIAGDQLVYNSIRSMQTHVLGAVVVQNLLASQRNRMADASKSVA